MKRAVCLVFLSALVGCGGGNSVTTPSTPAVAQVGGVWTGTVTQTSATGTECAALFQASNGASDRYTVQITQNGSSLTATSASQTSGIGCSYTGTVGGSTIALTGTSCTSAGLSGHVQRPRARRTSRGLQRDGHRQREYDDGHDWSELQHLSEKQHHKRSRHHRAQRQLHARPLSKPL
jgi:hypothetical protein